MTWDIYLVNMKSKLLNLLQYTNSPRVAKNEYHSPTINNKQKIKFNKFKLKMDGDVRIIMSPFYHCATKNPIEVDKTLARSTNDILNTMKHLEPSIGNEMLF